MDGVDGDRHGGMAWKRGFNGRQQEAEDQGVEK